MTTHFTYAKLGPLDGVSILIVEDELVARQQLRAVLSKKGASVSEANDGMQALDALRAQSFDVVLLDIQMPKMSGIELLKQLDAEAITTNVVVISGKSSLAELREVMQLGASDFLVKPIVDFNELIETILTAMESAVDVKQQLELAEFSAHKEALAHNDAEATRVMRELLPSATQELGEHFIHCKVEGIGLLPLIGQLNEKEFALALLDLSLLGSDAVFASVIAHGFFHDLWNRHQRGHDSSALNTAQALKELDFIISAAKLKGPLPCVYMIYQNESWRYSNVGVSQLSASFTDMHRTEGLGSQQLPEFVCAESIVSSHLEAKQVQMKNIFGDLIKIKAVKVS